MPWSSDRTAIWATALLLTAGCASIDPAPFQSFQQGAQTLRDGVAKPLKSEVDQARERAVADLVQNPLGLSGIQLQFGDPEYRWSYPEGGPLFTTLEQRNQAVKHLNEAFAAYAGLLLELASVQVLPDEQLDQQVKSINSSSRAFLAALGTAPAVGVTELLSMGFVEIVKELTEHRQRKRLKQAIDANQSTVQAFADAGAQLMTDVAAGIGLEYQSSFGRLQSAFVAATTEQRPAALQKILQLNGQTQSTLDVLGLLHGSYQTLPGAHRELAASLSGDAVSHRLEDFVGRAGHLAQLFEDLEKSDAGSSGGSAKKSTPTTTTPTTTTPTPTTTTPTTTTPTATEGAPASETPSGSGETGGETGGDTSEGSP